MAKRKVPEPEPEGNAVDGATEREPKRRKAKPSHEPAADPQVVGGDDEDEDHSFVRRVEARTRSKEERKRAKLEKKRKRQSDSSTNSRGKAPSHKKQKQRHETKVAERQSQNGKRSTGDSSSNGIPNGRPNKKRKK